MEKKNKGHNGGEEISTTVENNHNGGEENAPQRWKTATTVAKKMSHNGGNYHNCGKENVPQRWKLPQLWQRKYPQRWKRNVHKSGEEICTHQKFST